MKKALIYLFLFLGGIFLGYLFFNSSDKEKLATDKTAHEHETTEVWTCSMHPQIKQPEPGDCPICGMDLIPLESEKAGINPGQIKMTKNAMALADIQTSSVKKASAKDGALSLSGKVEVNEEAKSVQAAYVPGRLENFYIDFEGQKVNRGQLIAKIYSPDLVAAQQELLTAAKSKKNQPQLYQAVKNKLKAWKLSEKQITGIEESGEIKRNFPIHAQTGGTVSEKLVVEGDYIKEGQALYSLTPLAKVWAVFEAYENQIQNLAEGQNVEIKANAYPNKSFSGEIDFISPVLNKATRTVQIRVVLANKNQLLKPGMFVEAAVENSAVANQEENLSIPKSAVLWTGERSIVYVQPEDDKPIFEMRQISLGNANAENYTVLQGLKAGEKIVTQGAFTVDAAAQLEGKNSMLNQNDNTVTLPPENVERITAYLESYLDLKDALVESNLKQSTAILPTLLEQAENLQLVENETAFNKTIKNLQKRANYLSQAESLDKMRNYFIGLSEASIALATSSIKNKEFFVQECPMANSNQGAKWLSLEQEIKNPYYGEAMLTCGSVVRVLN